MNEYEKELIDIVFNNKIGDKNRIQYRVTEILPPDGIKSMVLCYDYKWGAYFLKFGRIENNNGFEFIAEYDIMEYMDDSYKAFSSEEGYEKYDFREKSENEMLKIALSFTTEQLNKLADEAEN